jgi:hypothetical protein
MQPPPPPQTIGHHNGQNSGIWVVKTGLPTIHIEALLFFSVLRLHFARSDFIPFRNSTVLNPIKMQACDYQIFAKHISYFTYCFFCNVSKLSVSVHCDFEQYPSALKLLSLDSTYVLLSFSTYKPLDATVYDKYPIVVKLTAQI